jgi:hypothetical protein
MAQTAISGADLTKLRGNQSIPDMSVFITPKVQVASGTISILGPRYPTTTLTMTWDGSTSDVAIGQMVEILNGTTPVSYGVVRKAVSGNLLNISETPLGAFGFATNIEAPILQGYTVKIYSHHPLWSLNSRIAGNLFYKFWDVAYTNQNEINAPVANAGAWQAAKLASGETTTRFTLPRSGSNISWAVGVETLPGGAYEWILPSGVTFVAGYDGSEAVIEVDAEAGQHLVTLTISNAGASHTAYVWLFVTNGTDGIDLVQDYAVSVPESDSQNRLGRTMKLSVYGIDLESVLYRGAGVLMREWPSYAGETLSTGTGIDSFIGYIADIQLSHDGNIPKATITIESPMVYAQRLGQPSQSLTEVSEATKWTECESMFSNARGFIYYLIRWHVPALMDMHDLDIPFAYESPRRKYLEVNNKSLQANLQQVADYITANIGSVSDGSTVMRKNPLYMSNTDRNAVPLIITWQEQDIRAPFEYFRRFYNAISDTRGGAFAFDGGNKPKAWAVGRRWGQGSGTAEMPAFTVTKAEGVTKAKEVIGHYTAEQNAEIQEIAFGLTANQHVIEPAYMAWYAFTVSEDFDPYASGFNGTRMLATEISVEWELDGGGIKKRITIQGQVETFGQAGEELPIGSTQIQNGYSPGFPVIWQPNTSTGMFGGSQTASIILALNEAGDFAMTSNYLTQLPDWTALNSSLNDEPVSDYDFDYASPYFASGRDVNEALGLYALTMDGNDVTLWYFADILRSTSAEAIEEWSLTGSSDLTNSRIKSSETLPSLALAVFKDSTGTRYSRSVDSGVTWGSLTRVGSAITDSEDNENAPIGLAVFGQYQFVTAPNSSNEYGVYRATTASGAFSKMTASQDSDTPHPMIAENVENNDYLYVSQFDVEAYRMGFDGGDDFTNEGCYTGGYLTPAFARVYDSVCFSLFPSLWVYSIAGTGNPGNSLKYTATSPNGDHTGANIFGIIFDWTSTGLDCYRMSFDVKFSSPTNSNRLVIVGSGFINNNLSGQDQWLHIDSNDYQGTGGYMLPFTGGQWNVTVGLQDDEIGVCTVEFDNFTFYLGDGYKLWRVEDATGTPNWVNVSPADGAPARPFDFAVDIVNPAVLNTVTDDSKIWYDSDDSGDNWSVVDSTTNVRALYTAGDAKLAGGEDETLALSLNGGGRYGDIVSNLDAVWDTFGRIKKLLAL